MNALSLGLPGREKCDAVRLHRSPGLSSTDSLRESGDDAIYKFQFSRETFDAVPMMGPH